MLPLFSKKKKSENVKGKKPDVNIPAQIDKIRTIEKETGPDLGRLIHAFEYGDFTLRLDRDVTGTYRVMITVGQERWYSFSVRSDYKNYTAIEKAYEEIIAFLGSDRRLADMPNHEKLKGHYFGPGGR
jgi:hypothetical protein